MRAFLSACPLALAILGFGLTPAAAGSAEGWSAARAEVVWTGAYIGLMAGHTRVEADSEISRTYGRFPASREFDGLGGGLYVGFMHQTQSGVTFGVEGDLYLSSASHDMPSQGHGVTKERFSVTTGARLRAGYAFGRLHPYLAGGVTTAYYNRENDYTELHGFLAGFTLGAGLEVAVTENLVARAEYLYTDYLEGDEIALGSGAVVGQTNLAAHDVRLGLALKF